MENDKEEIIVRDERQLEEILTQKQEPGTSGDGSHFVLAGKSSLNRLSAAPKGSGEHLDEPPRTSLIE